MNRRKFLTGIAAAAAVGPLAAKTAVHYDLILKPINSPGVTILGDFHYGCFPTVSDHARALMKLHEHATNYGLRVRGSHDFVEIFGGGDQT